MIKIMYAFANGHFYLMGKFTILKMVAFLKIVRMDKKINCQIKHEINSWLRLIEFFRQENALLKYRLSELVDNIDGSNFLQTAEYFQNEFLSKDEALKKLIKEIQNYSDYIEDQKKFPSQLLKNHNALRKNIHEFEENYIFLSEEFNKRMFKVITA